MQKVDKEAKHSQKRMSDLNAKRQATEIEVGKIYLRTTLICAIQIKNIYIYLKHQWDTRKNPLKRPKH